MHELDIIEHRLAAAPGLIPVIANTPNILSGFRVRHYSAGPLVDEISVVIPGNYLLVTQALPFHRRAEIVFQKVSLLFRGVYTGLPYLCRHRFVLNRNSPDRYAFSLISL